MSVCEDNFIVSKVLKYFSDKAVHLVRQLWTSETSVLPQTVHLFPWNNLQLFQQRLLLSAALLLGRKRTGSSLRLPARSYQDFADSSEDHPSSWHHRRCKSMHWVLHLLHLHGKKSHMPLMEHKPLQSNTRARWGESQANELDQIPARREGHSIQGLLEGRWEQRRSSREGAKLPVSCRLILGSGRLWRTPCQLQMWWWGIGGIYTHH